MKTHSKHWSTKVFHVVLSIVIIVQMHLAGALLPASNAEDLKNYSIPFNGAHILPLSPTQIVSNGEQVPSELRFVLLPDIYYVSENEYLSDKELVVEVNGNNIYREGLHESFDFVTGDGEIDQSHYDQFLGVNAYYHVSLIKNKLKEYGLSDGLNSKYDDGVQGTPFINKIIVDYSQDVYGNDMNMFEDGAIAFNARYPYANDAVLIYEKYIEGVFRSCTGRSAFSIKDRDWPYIYYFAFSIASDVGGYGDIVSDALGNSIEQEGYLDGCTLETKESQLLFAKGLREVEKKIIENDGSAEEARRLAALSTQVGFWEFDTGLNGVKAYLEADRRNNSRFYNEILAGFQTIFKGDLETLIEEKNDMSFHFISVEGLQQQSIRENDQWNIAKGTRGLLDVYAEDPYGHEYEAVILSGQDWIMPFYDGEKTTLDIDTEYIDAGLHIIQLQAIDEADNYRGDPVLLYLTITEDVNHAPILSETISDQTMKEGETLSFDITVNDYEGDYVGVLSTQLPEFIKVTVDDILYPYEFEKPVPTPVARISIDINPEAGDAGSYPINLLVVENQRDNGLSVPITFTLTVEEGENTAPTLSEAISDQTIKEGVATLMRKNIIDAEGDAVTLIANNSMPSFVKASIVDIPDDSYVPTRVVGVLQVAISPEAGDVGTYPIELTIVETGKDNPLSSKVSFTVTVEAVNHAPILSETISDQTMKEGETLSFDITVSDYEGDYVEVLSTQLPEFIKVTVDDILYPYEFEKPVPTPVARISIDINPEAGDAGSYPINLLVVENQRDNGLSVPITFTLTVEEGENTAPVLAQPIEAQRIKEGEEKVLEVDILDAQGDAVELITSNQLPPFIKAEIDHMYRINETTESTQEDLVYLQKVGILRITIKPGAEDAGTYPIKMLIAEQGTKSLEDDRLTTPIEFTLDVENVNRAPICAAIADQRLTAGQSVTVPILVEDPDGDAVRLKNINMDYYPIEYTTGLDAEQIDLIIPTQPTIKVNEACTEMTITASKDAGVGGYKVGLTFEDYGEGIVSLESEEIMFSLSVAMENTAPVLAKPIEAQRIKEGEEKVLEVDILDAQGDAVELITSNQLPPFIKAEIDHMYRINETTESTQEGLVYLQKVGILRITIKPGAEDAGIYPIKMLIAEQGTKSLEDDRLTTPIEFTLTVNDVNHAPTLDQTISDQTIKERETLSFDIPIRDAEMDHVSLLIKNLLPEFVNARLEYLVFAQQGVEEVPMVARLLIDIKPGVHTAGTYTINMAIVEDKREGGHVVPVNFTLTVNPIYRWSRHKK